jgi:hypothetical protein
MFKKAIFGQKNSCLKKLVQKYIGYKPYHDYLKSHVLIWKNVVHSISKGQYTAGRRQITLQYYFNFCSALLQSHYPTPCSALWGEGSVFSAA